MESWAAVCRGLEAISCESFTGAQVTGRPPDLPGHGMWQRQDSWGSSASPAPWGGWVTFTRGLSALECRLMLLRKPK